MEVLKEEIQEIIVLEEIQTQEEKEESVPNTVFTLETLSDTKSDAPVLVPTLLIQVYTMLKNKEAVSTVSTDMVNRAIQQIDRTIEAQKSSKEGEKKFEKENPRLEFKVNSKSEIDSSKFSLPKEAFERIVESKAQEVSIESEVALISLDKKVLQHISENADKNISIIASKAENTITEIQKELIGDAPVYEISIMSGSDRLREFGGGILTIQLPYTLKQGEYPDGIIVWYVDEKGKLYEVDTQYDVKTQKVTFVTNHLSNYAIGYQEERIWKNPYGDVDDQKWYYDAVKFVSSKKYMNGVAEDQFAPDDVLNRAMLVNILYKMENMPEVTSKSVFTDVEEGKRYSNAVLWASQQGISHGISENLFAPNQTITREQGIVMIRNYAKFKNEDVDSTFDLSKFEDEKEISTWAKEAISWANEKEIMKGKSQNLLKPSDSLTRAEIATIVTKFLNFK